MCRFAPIGLSVVAVLLFAGAAQADPFFFPGFDAESIALGGARTAGPSGAAAVAYNPAALNTGLQQTTFNYLWSKPVLHIDREPNADLNVYLRKGARGADDSDYNQIAFRTRVNARLEQAAERVNVMRGVQIGIVVPLAPRGATSATSLGFAAFVPQGKLATLQLGGESAPYFVEFADSNRAAMLSAAVGHDFGSGLSIGGGVVLDLIQADINASLYVPVRFSIVEAVLLSDEPLIPNADVQPIARADVAPRVRPILGARYAPNGKWAFGMSFRDQSKGRVEANGNVTLSSGDGAASTLPWKMDLSTHFQPRRASLGAQWKPAPVVRLMADLGWVQWSHYQPPLAAYSVGNIRGFAREALRASGMLDAGILGACLNIGNGGPCLPTEAALLARIPTRVRVGYEFSGARDIWVPRLGAGWAVMDQLELLAGYFYRPSMESKGGFRLIRETTYSGLRGGTLSKRESIEANVLDNSQHGFSMGAAFKNGAFTVTLAGQYVQLVEKTVSNDGGDVHYADQAKSPGTQITAFGYPGYRYGGHMAGAMLKVGAEY